MDIALTSSIINTATATSRQETTQAVQVAVLKKAMNANAEAAATLLEALPTPAGPALASSGTLGTQLDTYA